MTGEILPSGDGVVAVLGDLLVGLLGGLGGGALDGVGDVVGGLLSGVHDDGWVVFECLKFGVVVLLVFEMVGVFECVRWNEKTSCKFVRAALVYIEDPAFRFRCLELPSTSSCPNCLRRQLPIHWTLMTWGCLPEASCSKQSEEPHVL